MSIKIKIHKIDTKSRQAIISISDGDHVFVDKKLYLNIKLNDDGSANTEYLVQFAKYRAFKDRLERLDKIEDDLI